jgi:hypothetical protein
MLMLPKRVVNPSSTSESSNLPITLNRTSGGAKRNGEITGLAGTDYNPSYSRRMRDMLTAKRPRLQKPYDGTDKVGDAIHVNPTSSTATRENVSPKDSAMRANAQRARNLSLDRGAVVRAEELANSLLTD